MSQEDRIRESHRYIDDLVLEQKRFRFRRYEQILELYSALGVAIFATSLVYFVVTILPVTIGQTQRLTLIIGLAGLLIAFFSRVWLKLRRSLDARSAEEREQMISYFRLLDSWSEFEEKMRDIFDPEEKRGLNIRQMIMDLAEIDAIQDYEIEDVQRALYQRNKLMHGPRPFASDDIIDAVRTLEAVNAKLEMLQPHSSSFGPTAKPA